MLLSAPTRSTGKRQPQQIASHLPLKLPGGKKKTKSGKRSDAHSGKRTSSECCATVEDAPSSSTGKCKKTMAAPPETKKVSACDARDRRPRRFQKIPDVPGCPCVLLCLYYLFFCIASCHHAIMSYLFLHLNLNNSCGPSVHLNRGKMTSLYNI